METNKENLIENLKIAFIYGKNAVDGVNKDGQIEKIYKDEIDTAHYFYMKEFLETHFLDSKTLQNLKDKHDVNSIFFEIQQLGHIVFAENTSTPNLKTGLLYIPTSISDKQCHSLDLFRQKLAKENYTVTLLSNLFRTEDGVLMGTQKIGSPDILKNLTEIVQER